MKICDHRTRVKYRCGGIVVNGLFVLFHQSQDNMVDRIFRIGVYLLAGCKSLFCNFLGIFAQKDLCCDFHCHYSNRVDIFGMECANI
jgi:hypothetical protein